MAGLSLNCEVCSDDRDVLPEGRRIHTLILTFNFTQSEKVMNVLCHVVLTGQGDLRPIVPVLSSHLYESSYEAQHWILYDANKMRVACGDCFPSKYKTTLAKGDYVLKLQVGGCDGSFIANHP